MKAETVMERFGPKFNNEAIIEAKGKTFLVLNNDDLIDRGGMMIAAYRLLDDNKVVSQVPRVIVNQAFTLVKEKDGPLLPLPGWNKSSVTPPAVGYIVKRWNTDGQVRLWSGYFNGDPKMASCDEWMPLNIEK